MFEAVNQTAPRAEFPPTRWSAVLRLRERDGSGEKALAELCEIYWRPLFTFARRCGHSAHDAEDLTQGFFARLLKSELLVRADPARGRLRSFLLGAFRNYMSEEWRAATRQKRGGGFAPLSLQESPDLPSSSSAVSEADPESLFDRIWFDALLEHALNELEQEFRQRGKGEMFRRLQEFLAWNRKDGRLGEAAKELGMSPGAARVAVLRMRERFRQLIERQIAETVGSREDAAEELRRLRRVLGA